MLSNFVRVCSPLDYRVNCQMLALESLLLNVEMFINLNSICKL